MKFQRLLYFLQNVGKDPSALMAVDYLTGLKNRRFLLHYLKYEMDWEAIDERPVSLLVVDIDYFKRINEQYGSTVGDQALVHVAGLLTQASGKNGIPALSGGDEFMVLLPGVKKPGALILASNLVALSGENLFFSPEAGTQIPITLSIGVATAPDDAGSGGALLQRAKNAMHQAKKAGRNQFADAGAVVRQPIQYLDSVSIVGRKSQFAAVTAAVKDVKNGVNRFVIVDGASGMGKTVFLDVVQRHLEKSDFHVARAAGQPQESFRPYYLMAYVVMGLMNQREDRGVELLDDMEPADLVRLAYILPQIWEGPLDNRDLDEKEREAVFRTFIRFFIALADNRHLALLLDDLDYADPASLHLLRILLLEKTIPLFVCATATEAAVTSAKSIPLDIFRVACAEELNLQAIRLTPLTEGDIQQHLPIVLPGIDPPHELCRELAAVSQGHPLFIEEILRKMLADEKIVQSGGGWKVLKLEKGYFPKSLDEIIRTKLQKLDGGSRRFLDCASAFGESISLSMLTSVTDEKSAMVHDFLNKAIDQGIVRTDYRENDETIRFLCKDVRNVVYDRIHPDQKKNLHEQIGRYQEQLYEHHLLPSAAFLAHHYREAHNPEKTKQYESLQSDMNERLFNAEEAARWRAAADEIVGDTPIDASIMALVPKLLQSLLIAIRSVRLYPPESKSVTSAVGQFRQFLEKVLETTNRVSIIMEKTTLLINGQAQDTGHFQAIAQAITDLFDRFQLHSLTFVRGVTEAEVMIFLGRICRIEPREITPLFWETFRDTHALRFVFPLQVRYRKRQSPAMTSSVPGTAPAPGADALETETHQGFDEAQLAAVYKLVSAVLGSASKLKLYPEQGPVARQAAAHVMAALVPLFSDMTALTIARIDASLLVNGIRLGTLGYETLASGMIRFLTEARLSSITFLNTVSQADVTAFLAAAANPGDTTAEGSAFWQTISVEKGVQGILFDQRVYDIAAVVPGGEVREDSGEKAAEDAAEASVAEADEEASLNETTDWQMFPEHIKKAFLSGDRKRAVSLVRQLCLHYQRTDISEKSALLDAMADVLQPADWRPGPAYLNMVLGQVMQTLEGGKDYSDEKRWAAMLQGCGNALILAGEYASAAWVLERVQAMTNVALSDVLPDAAALVCEDLKSQDRSRQQEAFQLLSIVGKGMAPALIDMLKREGNQRVRRMVGELLKSQGPAGAAAIKSAVMAENRPEYRARMVEVLDVVTKDVMVELADCLSDPADVVRRAGFRLAERLNTPEVAALLMHLAQGEDPDIAAPAITSIGALNIRQAADILIQTAEKSDVRELLVAVCRAMGQMGDPIFAPVLENILLPPKRMFFRKKIDVSVRVAALYAVSRIPDPRVRPLMMALAEDPDPRIREVVKNISPVERP